MEKLAFSYGFGTAEFDEARAELRVAGLPVEVEPRALEVLAYLLRHAGEVVTKEELLREVWAGRVTVEKVLPNAINKLRRALGEANSGYVATVARLGYRLDGAVTRTAVGRQPASRLQLAIGQGAPERPNFELQEQRGVSDGGEVWLAAHRKTREQRVYKFAFDEDRIRALKREITLLRVLQESLADSSHFTELIDWNFTTPPYFLECKFGGSALSTWAKTHLPALDTTQRIALFLQIADAVAAAHSVGVLHKDLKPANVLVTGDAASPHVRLTDFGSGHMLEPDNLAQLGITRMGMTVEDLASADPTSGTPMYIAPEHFTGQAPTVKSDVFALGILLYQILSGRVGQPMVSGWETEIGDEFLCDDIRMATHGDPERRLASVSALSDRLRNIGHRRIDAEERRRAQESALRDKRVLERARARRPFVFALIAVLALGAATAIWLQQRALAARDQARMELDRATALAQFLNEDLIGRANPLVWAKGGEATLRDVLLSARERVPTRFAAQPGAATAIHSSLASLFSAVDLFPEAEAEARRALDLARGRGVEARNVEFEARVVLARVLSRQGRFEEAETHLAEIERLSKQTSIPHAQQQIALVRSTVLIGKNDFGNALVALRTAIDGLDASNPSALAQRDSLRVDLVKTLVMSGQNDEAIQEGQKLIAEAKSRKEDNELLVALTKVALVRAQGENHDAAEKLLTEAQPVIRARLGENHSRHLTLLAELQGIAFRRGDWPRAIEYAQMVYERFLAKFGAEHATTYVTLINWARTLDEAGRAKEAADKARAAYRQLYRLVGPTSPQAQDAAFVLALIELELGNTEQAMSLIDRLDSAVLESGRSHGLWRSGIDILRGIAFQQRGDIRRAKPLLDSGLEALKDEESLAQPSRLYLVAKDARARIP
ncbi:MAG: serine/threonine protein kinase [Lysobacteraceae bacterium]|nr:MAG: serine/threonine protein kinase [Xanthomonadaceae bacterium]